jgi:hypothetical protein
MGEFALKDLQAAPGEFGMVSRLCFVKPQGFEDARCGVAAYRREIERSMIAWIVACDRKRVRDDPATRPRERRRGWVVAR